MNSIELIRGAFFLLLVSGGIARGQAMLPATAPTESAGVTTAILPSTGVSDSGSGVTAPNVRHDAVVVSAGGKLEVVADGSSLNQTLREIGRVTGMKITGSVADEPVYGRYGPAPANEILSTLLDGTGSNMLLREATAVGRGELILTPRTGGVTPPDPNAPSSRAGYVEPNVPGSRTYQRPREPWMGPLPAGTTANGRSGGQPGNSSGQGGGAADQPNPQQIYQQLQRMQQIQPAAPERQQRPQQ